MGTSRQFGGTPNVYRNTAVSTTPVKHSLFQPSLEVKIEVSQDTKVYFSQEHADADKHFCVVTSTQPLQIAWQLREVWFATVAAGPGTVQMVYAGK